MPTHTLRHSKVLQRATSPIAVGHFDRPEFVAPRPERRALGAAALLVALMIALTLAGCAAPQRTLPPIAPQISTPPIEETRPEDTRAAIALAEDNVNDVDLVRHAIDRLLDDPKLNENLDWLDRAELLWLMLPDPSIAQDRARGALIAARRGEQAEALARLGGALSAWIPLGSDDESQLERFAREAQALIAEQQRDAWSLVIARAALDEHLWLDPQQQARHHRALWHAMASLPAVVVQSPALRTEALEARARDDLPRLNSSQRRNLEGWIELFAAAARLNNDETLGLAIREWSARFPLHPANAWLPALIANERRAEQYASDTPRVVLLAPLTGSLSALGEAVVEGALAAANARQPRLELDVVDTRSDPAEAARLYRDRRDRADVIIGPLSPEAVAAVLAIRESDDPPLLTLNRPSDGGRPSVNAGVSILALSPEVDGVAAAEHALANGHASALIAVVDDRIGPRAADAFSHHFKQGGGRVVEQVRIESGGRGSQSALNALLRTEDSEARRRQLSSATGLRLQSDPQPRGDVDMIYIPGNSGAVALIAPYLHFQRAQGWLWLGTQHLVDPAEGRASQDLSGFRYPEAPWVLDNLDQTATSQSSDNESFTPAGREAQRLRERIAEQVSAQESNRRYARFFALGIDAVRIADFPLESVMFDPGRSVIGTSGRWRLDPMTSSWQRDPQWVDIIAGRLVAVGHRDTNAAQFGTAIAFDGEDATDSEESPDTDTPPRDASIDPPLPNLSR
ncbi:MAG: penicillin-binding protein activator [Thioalkalivibrionaceae bacterium]